MARTWCFACQQATSAEGCGHHDAAEPPESSTPTPDVERAFREWFGLEQQGSASRYEAFLAGWQAREREVAQLRAALERFRRLYEPHLCQRPERCSICETLLDPLNELLAAQPRGEGAERG